MTVRFVLVSAVALPLAGMAIAQDDHKVEVTGDYSYFWFNPGLSKYFSSNSLNGGGGQVNFSSHRPSGSQAICKAMAAMVQLFRAALRATCSPTCSVRS